MEINGYTLSRAWFDFCFANPELINPNHTAIFFFAIEHCNRLGWKEKFGFPSQMTMDATGIKNHHTYIKYFQNLVDWGFFKLIQKSTNQYSANVISLNFGLSRNDKALDKAFIKHATKQQHSNPQSNDSIDKPITNKQITINKEPAPTGLGPGLENIWNEWVQHRKELKKKLTPSTVKKQIKFLGGRADPEIKEIINQSIQNGWTGLFELKANNNGSRINSKTTIRRADAPIAQPTDYGKF